MQRLPNTRGPAAARYVYREDTAEAAGGCRWLAGPLSIGRSSTVNSAMGLRRSAWIVSTRDESYVASPQSSVSNCSRVRSRRSVTVVDAALSNLTPAAQPRAAIAMLTSHPSARRSSAGAACSADNPYGSKRDDASHALSTWAPLTRANSWA